MHTLGDSHGVQERETHQAPSEGEAPEAGTSQAEEKVTPNRLLYFYQKNCGPCHGARQIIKHIRDLIKVEMQDIDADKEPALAAQYKVRSVPTLIVVDPQGRRIAGFTGGMIHPKTVLRALHL